MIKIWIKLFIICCIVYCAILNAFAENRAVQINVSGVISPATQDYIIRGIEYAKRHQAEVIIICLDTPGGLDESMRNINKAILSSSIPVVTYVSPEGARAASAGTYILYASHIAAMAPGTSLGAASPILIDKLSLLKEKEKKDFVLEKKITHDASAYLRSLAQMRNRNIEWAEKTVRDAVSLSAKEALDLKVIDLIADDISDLLKKLDHWSVKTIDSNKVLTTNSIKIDIQPIDWRYQILLIITNHNIAYILFIVGIYGLFFEFYSPGFILPGIVGSICLLLSLYAFQLLPINYTGFALLFLGMIFLIMEAILPSFGVLGIGGIIAFVSGSILLLDSEQPNFSLALSLILVMTVIVVLFFFVIVNIISKAMKKKIITGREALIGKIGTIIAQNNEEYVINVSGETWNACSASHLRVAEKVKVVDLRGLVLVIEPIKDFDILSDKK